ncbi:MAG: FAD-dependent oxidoreductase, partial [Caulobacterales bacterium]|nr:FAD-dependent oxidoreductase [Caulobacterales bacterium]
VGVGATPNDELAQACGLTCADGIVTDEAGRTSDPHVFAIGDCACAWSPIYDRSIRLQSVQAALDGAKAAAAAIRGAPPPAAPCPWNWSDQYEARLKTAGVSDGADEAVVRGEPMSGSFAVFYLRDGRVIACDAVNAASEFLTARELIVRRAHVPADALGDTAIPVKDLARTALHNGQDHLHRA